MLQTTSLLHLKPLSCLHVYCGWAVVGRTPDTGGSSREPPIPGDKNPYGYKGRVDLVIMPRDCETRTDASLVFLSTSRLF